ncbi:unnamed protein product [marine sediment metagenome]|uniref:Uncharacterized protein n=1 Tax=marine sediment metagenome TaxID=412755 RepID=X1VHN4_9ZZZZ
MFNLIYNRYVIKIDFIVKKLSAYQNAAFSRRKEILIEGGPIWFVSAEDLIISKLLWAKDSHSEMQLKDVGNLMETVDNLDLKYIDNWVRELGLESTKYRNGQAVTLYKIAVHFLLQLPSRCKPINGMSIINT